jgi:alkylation response protein AidB-like acyl-CoA dehydrogenase
MDVQFTEEQSLLRETAASFLADRCPIELVRAVMESKDGPSAAVDELWNAAASMGWTGLIIGEEHGGAGLGAVELAVLLEETGRVLMPAPLLSTVIGAYAIAIAGDEAQQARYLPAIATGKLRASLAQLEDGIGRWGPGGISLAAERTAKGLELTGTKLFAIDAGLAGLLIVPVRTFGSGADGITLLVVEASTPGMTVEPTAYTDSTRKLATVSFDAAVVPKDAVLGEIGEGWPLLERVLDFAKVAVSAEMCGGAARVLELSVDYAKTREQFGRPIGSFQAIQHKCADMLVLLESARSSAYYAAWALANDEPEAHVSACMAKAYCSDAFTRVAGEGIQIHGGMGFTWEADLHLYYKRAKASALAFGDPVYNRELVARAVVDQRAS